MARIPASDDERPIGPDRIAEVWDDIDSPEEPEAFFAALEELVPPGDPLDYGSKVKFAEAIAQLCARLRSTQDVGVLRQAKRIVAAARREIATLQRRNRERRRRVAEAQGERRKEVEIETGREAWPSYQALHRRLAQLQTLAGAVVPGGPMDTRLALPLIALQAAVNVIERPGSMDELGSTPLTTTDYAGALAILDEALGDWAAKTESPKRQPYRNKALDDFIQRIKALLADATGVDLPTDVVASILRRVFKALPPDLACLAKKWDPEVWEWRPLEARVRGRKRRRTP